MTLSKLARIFNSVVLLALIAFLVPVVLIEYNVLQHTNGTFSYGSDDTFLHMAIAKNLAFKGLWGPSAAGFASATSSLLYPTVLALTFEIFGLQNVIPVLVNTTCAIILIILIQKWLEKQQIKSTAQFLILLGVIYLTPLPILVISGMEHTLKLLFCFLFLSNFSDIMNRVPENIFSSEKSEWKLPNKVCLFGLLMVATSYDSFTIIGVAVLILLYHRKYWSAFQLGIVTLLPIMIFGIYSLFKGSYFFPNSILLKSEAPSFTIQGLTNFITTGLWRRLVDPSIDTMGYNAASIQRLLFILPAFLLLFWKQVRENKAYYYYLIILITTVILYLSFVSTAKLPGSEAYLIGNTVLIIGILIAKYGRLLWDNLTGIKLYLSLAGSVLLIFPLIIRANISFEEIGQSCINIYEQQYQMGRFVRAHYYYDPVAVNNLGAVAFLSDGPKLDLFGLGSIEVARSRKDGYWSADFLEDVCQKKTIFIAIVYDSWFPQKLLRQWNKVASWQILNNVVCAGDKVSFYAIDSSGISDLRSNLKSFQPNLPRDIRVNYY